MQDELVATLIHKPIALKLETDLSAECTVLLEELLPLRLRLDLLSIRRSNGIRRFGISRRSSEMRTDRSQVALLLRLLVAQLLCILAIQQSVRPLSSATFRTSPGFTDHMRGLTRHAVEEVGSSLVEDNGALRTTSEAKDLPMSEPPSPNLGEGEVTIREFPKRLFHRRIAPRALDNDN